MFRRGKDKIGGATQVEKYELRLRRRRQERSGLSKSLRRQKCRDSHKLRISCADRMQPPVMSPLATRIAGMSELVVESALLKTDLLAPLPKLATGHFHKPLNSVPRSISINASVDETEAACVSDGVSASLPCIRRLAAATRCRQGATCTTND